MPSGASPEPIRTAGITSPMAVVSDAPMRTVRLITLALLSLLLVALALPASAAEDTPPPPDAVEEESDTEGIQTGYEAAVPIEDEAEAAREEPWTTKFLVPTTLLLAAVAIFATVVMYFLKVVRTRYKVVE